MIEQESIAIRAPRDEDGVWIQRLLRASRPIHDELAFELRLTVNPLAR